MRPQYLSHLCRKLPQGRHHGKAVPRPPHLCHPAHFRADAKSIHPPRQGAQMRVMQNKPPIAPLLRAAINHLPIGQTKIPNQGRAHKGRNLSLRFSAAIRAANLPRRFGQGDAPAPWQYGLIHRIRPRVRQTILRHLLHQKKRIKHHLFARCLDRRNRLDHRAIRRRAAINRPPVALRQHLCCLAPNARDDPRHLNPVLRILVHLGPHLRQPAPQVIAKPTHHQGYRSAARQFLVQMLQRQAEISLILDRMHIGSRPHPRPVLKANLGRGQRIFPRPRDHRHRLHAARQIAIIAFGGDRPTHHLKPKLRHAVAKA